MNWFYVTFCVLFAVSLGNLLLINDVFPDPFMDEHCHVPQCQNYCKGNFTWDPKITTLPGLYFFSMAVLKTLQPFVGYEDACSTLNLRAVNMGINLVNYWVLFAITKRKFPYLDEVKATLMALNMALVPLLYFFSFMYYTEPLATLSILLMHYFWMKRAFNLSALAGLMAVLNRQTNIVWVFYHGLLTLYTFAEESRLFKFKPVQTVKMHGTSSSSIDPAINNNTIPKDQNENVIDQMSTRSERIHRFLQSVSELTIAQVFKLIQNCSAYLLIGLSFVIFVHYNNGIVVGDRTSHQVTLNSPQVLYFSLFTLILTLPTFISKKAWGFSIQKDSMIITALLTVVIFSMVHWNTEGHIYNLTDPHHFTHYFLHFVYDRAIGGYLLVPLYVAAWLFIWNTMKEVNSTFITASWVLCVFMNLAFHLLLEFRYFVPGYLFFRMNLSSSSHKALLAEFVLSVVINVIAIVTLVTKPIEWPPEDEADMIIW